MLPSDRAPASGRAIGIYWDAVVDGATTDEISIASDVATAIRTAHDLEDVPGPDPALVAAMWTDVLSRVGAVESALPGALPMSAWNSRLAHFGRQTELAVDGVLAGAAAGAITGILVLGIGLRVAMRIAGAMTDSASRSAITENGNRVGEFTLGGSMVLIVLGALIGALLGIGYLIVRPWLPVSPWWRGASYGLLMFALGGTSLFENGRNPDYRQFGIAGVNVCLFGLLPLLFGLVVSPLADRFDRRYELQRSVHAASGDAGWSLARAMLAAFLGLAALWGALAAPPVALLLLLLLARAGIKHLLGRFESPADLFRRPLIAIPAYALILVPALVGLASTLLAIERILA